MFDASNVKTIRNVRQTNQNAKSYLSFQEIGPDYRSTIDFTVIAGLNGGPLWSLIDFKGRTVRTALPELRDVEGHSYLLDRIGVEIESKAENPSLGVFWIYRLRRRKSNRRKRHN